MEIKYGNEKDAEIQRVLDFRIFFFHFGEDIGIKHLHAVTVYGNFLTMNGNGKTGATDHMGEVAERLFGYEQAAKADCKYPLRNKRQEQE